MNDCLFASMQDKTAHNSGIQYMHTKLRSSNLQFYSIPLLINIQTTTTPPSHPTPTISLPASSAAPSKSPPASTTKVSSFSHPDYAEELELDLRLLRDSSAKSYSAPYYPVHAQSTNLPREFSSHSIQNHYCSVSKWGTALGSKALTPPFAFSSVRLEFAYSPAAWGSISRGINARTEVQVGP